MSRKRIMKTRRNFKPKALPVKIAKTSRSKATGLYVYPKTMRYPIGDLYHARQALVFVLSPTNASSRKTVAKAVQKAYPTYDWGAWWNSKRKGKKGVPTWNTLIQSKKKQKRNPNHLWYGRSLTGKEIKRGNKTFSMNDVKNYMEQHDFEVFPHPFDENVIYAIGVHRTNRNDFYVFEFNNKLEKNRVIISYNQITPKEAKSLSWFGKAYGHRHSQQDSVPKRGLQQRKILLNKLRDYSNGGVSTLYPPPNSKVNLVLGIRSFKKSLAFIKAFYRGEADRIDYSDMKKNTSKLKSPPTADWVVVEDTPQTWVSKGPTFGFKKSSSPYNFDYYLFITPSGWGFERVDNSAIFGQGRTLEETLMLIRSKDKSARKNTRRNSAGTQQKTVTLKLTPSEFRLLENFYSGEPSDLDYFVKNNHILSKRSRMRGYNELYLDLNDLDNFYVAVSRAYEIALALGLEEEQMRLSKIHAKIQKGFKSFEHPTKRRNTAGKRKVYDIYEYEGLTDLDYDGIPKTYYVIATSKEEALEKALKNDKLKREYGMVTGLRSTPEVIEYYGSVVNYFVGRDPLFRKVDTSKYKRFKSVKNPSKLHKFISLFAQEKYSQAYKLLSKEEIAYAKKLLKKLKTTPTQPAIVYVIAREQGL